ncbi:hypothetical protein D9M69_663140 [compost metagenome]
MRGILNGVGEGNQFLVGIEAGGKQLPHHHRRQAGRLRTNNRQRLVPGAIRAIVMSLDELRAIAGCLAQVVRNMHSHQGLILTLRTFGLRRRVQSATTWAHLFVLKDL